MKKTLPFFLLLCSAGLIAQPTFTANDMYGLSYQFTTNGVSAPSAIDLSITGANSTWNFPSLQTSGSSQTSHVAPTGQPGATNFPQATLCQAVTSAQGNPGYYYIRSTPTAFSIDGVYSTSQAGQTVSQFNPDLDIFRFPFTFNSTFTQPVGGTTTTAGYVYFREGTQTVTCDGFGTLTTPLGTFQNVLRLKTTQTYSDSINFGGSSQVFQYVTTIYNWVSPQSKGVSLLSHTSFDVDGGAPTVYGTMSSLPEVSIEDISQTLSFNLFPNPALDLLTIQLPAVSTEEMNAEIFSATGQLIRKEVAINRGTGFFNLELEGIVPGAYFLRLSDKKYSGVQRFIVQ